MENTRTKSSKLSNEHFPFQEDNLRDHTVDGGEHAATPAGAAKSPSWGFFRISYRGVLFHLSN